MIKWDELSNSEIKQKQIELQEEYDNVKIELSLTENKLHDLQMTLENKKQSLINKLNEVNNEFKKSVHILTNRKTNDR